MFETVLLLVTCVWIINEAVERLFFAENVTVDPNLWAFLVVILSIVVDYSRSRALKRAADKIRQPSARGRRPAFFDRHLVVSRGAAGALRRMFERILGNALARPAPTQRPPWGVAAIVIIVSYQLGKKSIDDLLDTVPGSLRDQVITAAKQVSGMEDVTQLRFAP